MRAATKQAAMTDVMLPSGFGSAVTSEPPNAVLDALQWLRETYSTHRFVNERDVCVCPPKS